MEEKWLPCDDEDILNYEVSSEGRIRNSKTGRILKTNVNNNGYEIVSINRHTKRIHKLVADTFIDGEHSGLDILHKDGNRLNNRADNLEYKTHSEIMKRTYENGREQTHRMRAIRCIETGEEYRSIKECSEVTGLNRSSISKCVNNPATKTYDGRHFEAIK